MKTRMITYLFAAFISALAFTACSKKADTPTEGGGITKEKLVGTYKITEIKLVSESGTEDVLAEQSACDRDNFFQLKADMTAVIIDAGQQCSPSSDDTGTWEYRDASTVVLNGTLFTIKSMVGPTLKMSSEDTEAQSVLNVTYVKQ